MRLTTLNHDRDVAGMTYVYPVVSRRAGGVSIGVNLNPNNACNWRCIYCQVPGLVAGKGPVIDSSQLESELRSMVDAVENGDFLERHVPVEARRLNDVAFSGNGEPTSSPSFPDAVEIVRQVLSDFELLGAIKVVLITNGSLASKPEVLDAIARMAEMNGEVWFKLDSATREGAERINSTPVEPERHLRRLREVAARCPTWIQTCVVALDGEPPSEAEQTAYLDALGALADEKVPLRGVLLYGLARESHQPEASRLGVVDRDWLDTLADRIRGRGLTARVH